jgi:DNA repair exonuclease SbcCD ATPase subunit
MELPAHSRREIIEDLLDIQVFSTMNTLLKDRVGLNKENINENSYQKDLIENKIQTAEEHNDSIRKIKEKEVDKIRAKMTEHITKIEEEKGNIESIETVVESKYETITDKPTVKDKLEKAKRLKQELVIKLRGHHDELSFYNNHDNCPTCKQGIEHDFKETIITDKGKKIGELDGGLEQLLEKVKGYESRIEEISSVEDEIRDNNLKIGDHRAQIKVSKGALVGFSNELKSAEEDVEAVDTTKLEEFKSKLNSIEVEQTDLFNRKEILSVVSTMLKDGGIKSKIIRQYIPVMNKLINKYLSAFDLFVDFQLDENFNEVIKSRFRDTFSYASFSEGEKLRITLSIMLAWRTVAKLRNSVSTNLLVLDETLDGAMDGVGVENLIETLQNLNADDNIFVISHRGDQFGDKFVSHLKFQKVKNFSEIAA